MKERAMAGHINGCCCCWPVELQGAGVAPLRFSKMLRADRRDGIGGCDAAMEHVGRRGGSTGKKVFRLERFLWGWSIITFLRLRGYSARLELPVYDAGEGVNRLGRSFARSSKSNCGAR